METGRISAFARLGRRSISAAMPAVLGVAGCGSSGASTNSVGAGGAAGSDAGAPDGGGDAAGAAGQGGGGGVWDAGSGGTDASSGGGGTGGAGGSAGAAGMGGQPSHPTWSKSFGGGSDDTAVDIVEAQDGGFVVVGRTGSFFGAYDLWLLKLDQFGIPGWQRAFRPVGGEGAPMYPDSITRSHDGGTLTAAWAEVGATAYQLWLLHVDVQGEPVWQREVGTFLEDYQPYLHADVRPTPDGGYVVGTSTGSSSEHGTLSDVVLLRLDGTGQVTWKATYGGKFDDDYAYSTEVNADGSVLVAGYTGSYGSGDLDAWVLWLEADGRIRRQMTYGKYAPAGFDMARYAKQKSDGGYVVVGNTSETESDSDIFVLELDPNGQVVWQKIYVGDAPVTVASVQLLDDGGYLVASTCGGQVNMCLLRLDSAGVVRWARQMGGEYADFARRAVSWSTGGYVAVGELRSLQGGRSDANAWVVRLDESGRVGGRCVEGMEGEVVMVAGDGDLEAHASSSGRYEETVVPAGESEEPAMDTSEYAEVQDQCTPEL